MGMKNVIVEGLARRRFVEETVLRIAGPHADGSDLEDLCQMVYLVLLEYDECKLCSVVEAGALSYLVTSIVIRNLRSRTSRFYYAIKAFRDRSCDLSVTEGKA